ncbi:M23 family metallopeptidase [Xanthocytophaga agilis]|uniref:M23 family metallopeptidase n=1 Tax=Xanthocytophaga agilis TaxID=3048010 RepID=A0AAE3R2G1_9BACT|nr:M23 family metallopeptidase [Xanthocytophaga agilis]MDJ1502529.1 M23 family metallopeptidase [Xanthocytophaga agilis]
MTNYLHRRKNHYFTFSLCTAFLLFLTSCGKTTPFREVFKKATPYEQYQKALEDTKLDQTAIGRDWLLAGQRALHDSLLISIPFQETGYFGAEKPTAYSFRFNARRGERITIQVGVQSLQKVKVFVDVFEWEGAPKSLISADTNVTSVTFEAERDQMHLVRIQPELLRSGRYTLSITNSPSLGFPVQGKTDKHIGSFWGADRDGGARRHEGVDIFAARGTPAIASTKGVIRGVNTNNLGGKVVWLWDQERNQTLYYAHLDSQLVQTGQLVNPGDTLGLVGTTGNARFTAPHLHFGIYRWPSGAIDPYPFIKASSGMPADIKVPLDNLGMWYRVSAKKASVYHTPDKKSLLLQSIERHTPFIVVGGSALWYHIILPSGVNGYIAAKDIEKVRIPVDQLKVQQNTSITDQPDSRAAVMQTIAKGESVFALAKFGSYWLVETTRHGLGWVQTAL